MSCGDITARRLAASLHLRVALAGSGAFRARQDGNGAVTALCVLPGGGHVVSIRHAADHLAQISYPDTRPLSSELPLSEPRWLGPLMNTVDFHICCDDFHSGGAERARFRSPLLGGIPTEMFDLADAAIRSVDSSIRNAARSLPCDTVDLPTALHGPWQLPEEARPFVAACQASTDPEVAAAASLLCAVSALRTPSCPFVPFISRLRWKDADPAPAEQVPLPVGMWLRLTNPAALAADSLRVGLPCRHLLALDAAGEPLPLGEREFWSLRSHDGCRGLAVIEQGELRTFHPGPGARTREDLQQHAVDALCHARSMSRGMRPR